jgi:DNA polymerase IV (family X)
MNALSDDRYDEHSKEHAEAIGWEKGQHSRALMEARERLKEAENLGLNPVERAAREQHKLRKQVEDFDYQIDWTFYKTEYEQRRNSRELETYAEFLRLDNQNGRAHAYDKAAQALQKSHRVPPDPSRLDGIGPSTREEVISFENEVPVERYEQLKEKYPWYEAFRNVKHIGPSRAKKIHETFGIETFSKLRMVANAGDLTLVSGIGPATEKKIQQSIRKQ